MIPRYEEGTGIPCTLLVAWVDVPRLPSPESGGCGGGRYVGGEAVEALRVVAEDGALVGVGDLGVAHDVLQGVRPAAVPVRVIGGVEQLVRAEALDDVGNG